MHVTFTLIPAASTSTVSVQILGFKDIGLLTHCDRLVCDFCSSGQCFAFSFLQIPSRDGHPCRSANRSPCRADSGLSPPSHPTATTRIGTAPVKALRAMPGAPKKGDGLCGVRPLFFCLSLISYQHLSPPPVLPFWPVLNRNSVTHWVSFVAIIICGMANRV
jgi:hypothetical protein